MFTAHSIIVIAVTTLEGLKDCIQAICLKPLVTISMLYSRQITMMIGRRTYVRPAVSAKRGPRSNLPAVFQMGRASISHSTIERAPTVRDAALWHFHNIIQYQRLSCRVSS